MIDPEWWRAFFFEPWSKIQADGYPEERTSSECDLIQKVLALRPGARVLDIPCGTGRHTIELARRGFEMTGVDFNQNYINVGTAAAAARNLRPRFMTADMRDFEADELFDSAFCYFGSFGYFLEADDERFARAVARSLRSGGRFVIEGHLAETLLPIFQERDWSWIGPPDRGVRLIQERKWNLDSGRVESEWTIIEGDSIQTSATSLRVYFYRELRDILQRAGFSSVTLLDGTTGDAFRIGAARALVVAERRLGDSRSDTATRPRG